MQSKVVPAQQALEAFHDGMTIMISGFTNVGAPNRFIMKLVEQGIKDIHLISNDAGNDHTDGIGTLVCRRRVSTLIASHIGLNPEAGRQMSAAGLGGVLTPTGVGTVVAEGKQVIEVNGRRYLLELPLRAQIAIVHAARADAAGNLVYHRCGRNFNPMMAMAADLVIAEAEEVVEVGQLDPDEIMTPGVCVDMVVKERE